MRCLCDTGSGVGTSILSQPSQEGQDTKPGIQQVPSKQGKAASGPEVTQPRPGAQQGPPLDTAKMASL